MPSRRRGAKPVVREPLAEELQQKFSDAEGRLAKLEEEAARSAL